MFTTFNNALARALKLAIGLIMTATVLILFAGVVMRYLFNSPLFWSEEVTVLGMIWMTFLAGALLIRDDKNVSITIFYDMCGQSGARWMKILADALVTIMLVVMVWQSWLLTGRLSFSTTPAIRLSESWFGWALVVGFICMLYFQVLELVALILDRRSEPVKKKGEGVV
ncbi:MAG: TRAP transporter small permease [Desulfopila sp.]